MRIVVTDVTRMMEGYCCVAGIDRDTGEHIRPVLSERLRRDLLAPSGPFALGAIVDLGEVQDAGSAPMVEDRRFEPGEARRTGTLAPDQFWDLVLAGSRRRLRDIFSDALACSRGRRAEPPTLDVEEYDEPRLKMRFTDDDLGDLNLPVTDIRFFDERHELLAGVVTHTATRLRRGQCVVGVGLGRAWSPQHGQPERHWLQVNGVHLADDPLWTVSGR